jgi:hypothetical protein
MVIDQIIQYYIKILNAAPSNLPVFSIQGEGCEILLKTVRKTSSGGLDHAVLPLLT